MLDAIYIHIPFCRKKCAYCDFLSFENREDEIEKYVNYIIKEIELNEKYNYNTVYFGGGTPSLLSPDQVERILSKLQIENGCEITLEVNPVTVNREKLEKYKQVGVNRLSIGIQSFDDKILKTLGRLHNSKKAIETFELARLAGFDNISIDLMFAVPGQTFEILNNDLDKVKSLNPEHVSIYSLIWEEETKFWDLKEKNILSPLSDEIEANMFELIIDKLKEYGYVHYEISNFCKMDFEAKHNTKYWKNRKYLGIGLGASGYVKNVRYKNVCFLNDFYGRINIEELPVEESEIVTDFKEYERILGLRLLQDGILVSTESELNLCRDLVNRGFLQENANNNFILTNKGLFYANDVFMEFLKGDTSDK